MGEFNPSPDLRENNRVLILFYQRFFAHDGKYLLRRSNGRLQSGKLLCQLLNGLKKGLNILSKDVQCTDGNHISHDFAAAHTQDNHQGNNAQNVYQRPENGEYHHFPVACTEQLIILVIKLFILPFLSAEYLNDAHTGNVLRQKSIHIRQPRSGDAVGLACNLAEYHGQHRHNGKQYEGNQRQLFVHHQHHHSQSHNLHNVAEQPNQNAGIHFIQRLHVIGDAGHQPAHRCQVKIAAAQRLNMGIQLLAHSENNALPHLLQQPGLGNVEHKAQHQHNGILYGSLHNYIEIPLLFEQVDGITDQHGTVQIKTGQRQHQRQTDNHPPHVRFHIRKQVQQGIALVTGLYIIIG